MRVRMLPRITSALLSVFYLSMVRKVIRDNGDVALSYFCTSTWMLLSLFFLVVSMAPGGLQRPGFIVTLGIQVLGASCAMSTGVLFYWEDRFTNPEHVFVHYLPTVVLSTLLYRSCIGKYSVLAYLLIANIWPVLYALLQINATGIYEREFPGRIYTVPIALAAPLLLRVVHC